MTETKQLGDLQRNDYNPRFAPERHGGEVDIDVASLADSIENVGLDNALTVRPIGDEKFEVVTGERRFHALQAAFDDDHEVKVDVEDLTDEQARERCRAENEEREDLTTMQETWGYAEQVTDYKEYESYAKYVESLQQDLVEDILHVPANSNNDVKRLSDTGDKSTTTITDWLSFLLLPPKAHDWIDNGDLTKRAARIIVKRVRNGRQHHSVDEADQYEGVDDTEAAVEIMGELAEKHGPGHENGMSDEDYGTLEDDIKGRIEEYHRRRADAEEDVEVYYDRVFDNLRTLSGTLERAHEDYDAQYPVPEIESWDESLDDEDPSVSDINFDEIETGVKEYREELDEYSSNLSDSAEDLEPTLDSKRASKRKMERVVNNHEDGDCPYCQQSVDVSALRESIKSLSSDADDLAGEIRSTKSTVKNIASTRASLHEDLNSLLRARDSYEEAYSEAMDMGLDMEGDQ